MSFIVDRVSCIAKQAMALKVMDGKREGKSFAKLNFKSIKSNFSRIIK